MDIGNSRDLVIKYYKLVSHRQTTLFFYELQFSWPKTYTLMVSYYTNAIDDTGVVSRC